MSRETVDETPRIAFTPKQRAEAFLNAKGHCAMCAVKIKGGRYEVDHVIQRWMGGPHVPSNWQVLCVPCHRTIKTPVDAKKRAKVKRIIARENGTRRPRKPIPSKGFDTTIKRAIPSRQFAKRGEVVSR